MRQWTPAELNMLRQLYENMQDGNPVREVIIEYEEEGKTEQIHITDPRLVKIMTHAAMEVYGKNKNP